jgi:hypothetical protein
MNPSRYSASDIPPYLRERNSFLFSLVNLAGMWWFLKLSVNSCQVMASGVAWAVV